MQSPILYILIIIDALIMGLGIFLPISNYNAIFNGIYSILLIATLRNNGGFWVFSLGSATFFWLVSANQMYVIFDCFTVITTIGLLIVFCKESFFINDLLKTKRILLFYYCLNLLLCLVPSYYAVGENLFRYLGIFRSANLSVSVMTIIGIAIWEIEKACKTNPKRAILIVNIIGLVILMFATRTRTLLFLIPYWIYQCYHFFNRKAFIGIAIIAAIIFGQIIYQSISKRMNFDGDESTATRAKIYEVFIRRIIKNYVVIPHGSNESFIFIKKFTGNPNFSAHNDFLRYLYDWGAYFLIFLVYIAKIIRKYIYRNIELGFIFLGYAALALHNLLFLPIAWIPFCIILNMRRNNVNYTVSNNLNSAIYHISNF